METISIRSLVSADLPDAAKLLTSLNPETPLEIIETRLHTLLADHPHYDLFGAFSNGKLTGLVGAWIATKIWCGRYLEIDNLVVDPESRSGGVGTMLIKHLEAMAHERDCKIIVLDSYTANKPSHRLYHRLGFEIWGFHFIKPIGDWKSS
jgi:ribosomal protein S18 acetylase RimI-like enzyme